MRPGFYLIQIDLWMSVAGLAIGLLASPWCAWAGWCLGCKFKGSPKYDLPFWPDEFSQGDD